MSLLVEFWESGADNLLMEVVMPAMPRIHEQITLEEPGRFVDMRVIAAGYYIQSATSNKTWVTVQEIDSASTT